MARRLQGLLDGDSDKLANAQNLWAMENFAAMAEVSDKIKRASK